MNYFCCDELRRNAVRDSALNGIDFLEVLDQDAALETDRQRFLFIHFVKPLAVTLGVDNICIDGGERIRGITVVSATPGVAPQDNVLTVEVDKPGDFSIYRLSLVVSATDPEPPDGFDSVLSAIDFSFKVECPTPFDCAPERVCIPAADPAPSIDYLAKDYASFRRLMLDRIASIAPDWRERNPADLGIALVELLAYVADHLSYQQDAVATEAYLGTARRRTSVRRHARLVDYFLNDGSNARTWVHIAVSADVRKGVPEDPPQLPTGTALTTRIPGESLHLAANPDLLARARAVFETVHPLEELYRAHNELPFYTWSDQECCLPKGATAATLLGHFPDLATGDALLFEEVLGARSGAPADADPTRRHVVRLTDVIAFDALLAKLQDPITGEEITKIHWDAPDALPFPLCISSRTDREHGSEYIDNVSVARGNMVLADHGQTLFDEPLGTVPAATLFRPPDRNRDPCVDVDRDPLPPRFRPTLAERPLTQAWSYEPAAPAIAALTVPTHGLVSDTAPSIVLNSTLNADTATWLPRSDLLNSGADATEFVAEIEGDLTATLRFGDDEHGERPNSGTAFTATYRVGNGPAGNIGAESLSHIADAPSEITGVRNPQSAIGGTAPESIEDARKNAPEAFRVQQRAVTPADYAEVTERNDEVQRAAASFRWTGSWHTVFITADRNLGLDVDAPFETRIRDHVEPFRMAGYDIEVDGPLFVPLKIEMKICVNADYLRSDVRAALIEVFSNRDLPDGRRGLFHPDNFSFGQTVYLSPLYAAAQEVDGVDSVNITTFQRHGIDDSLAREEGELRLDRLEIARLDNDPNFAERGVFKLSLGGGK